MTEKDTAYKQKSRKAGMVLITSDKVDFKARSFAREKEGIFIKKRGHPLERCNNSKLVCTNNIASKYI